MAKVSADVNPNPEPLKVNVQVLNTGNTNLIGSIHVISDITGATKNSNGITFPAGQTIIKPFEFNLSEIPKGTIMMLRWFMVMTIPKEYLLLTIKLKINQQHLSA